MLQKCIAKTNHEYRYLGMDTRYEKCLPRLRELLKLKSTHFIAWMYVASKLSRKRVVTLFI